MDEHPDLSSGSSWAAKGGPFSADESGGDGRGVMVFVALFASALVLLGIGIFVMTRDSPSGDAASGATEPALVTTAPPGTVEAPAATSAATVAPVASVAPVATEATAPVPATNLFTGERIAGIVDEVAVARGANPLRILSVVIYPDYLIAQVQDPALPANVDEYEWRGQLGSPVPVRLVGDGDIEANLYSADEVDWPAIGALVAAAPGAVAVEGGAVTHLNVQRSLPFSDSIRIRVFVNGTRDSGFVDADANGAIFSVNGS
jgi:hypothetical protein